MPGINHPIPECAAAFGRIEAAQTHAKELRAAQSTEIQGLHKEVLKLTGNGNKGRIDSLAEQTAVNTALLKKMDYRFDRIYNLIEKNEHRVWTMAGKVAGLVGSAGIIGIILSAVFL